MKIMGYNIFNGDISDIALFHSKRTIINTINPHSYVVAGGDSLFRKSLISSDILIPDGGGILLAARLILNKKIKKITGPDIHEALLINLNMKNGKCFYMGASQRTLNLIKKRISKEFPKILVEIYSPPFSDTFSEAENLDIVNNINNFSPDVLFIGMTAPKQEKWLYENKDKLDFKVATCIGAAFDFYAGSVKRSSSIWRKIHMEWLPRLVRDPKKLWRRTFISSPIFILDILKFKFRIK
jgi:N-acetylglucosaminyldiphosphoundecaprenol N-acetyl-beta-D-mannosaminyltransferase